MKKSAIPFDAGTAVKTSSEVICGILLNPASLAVQRNFPSPPDRGLALLLRKAVAVCSIQCEWRRKHMTAFTFAAGDSVVIGIGQFVHRQNT